MYICPICNREFTTDIAVAKHSLACWREKNPNHKSKPAPRSEDVVNREINDNVMNFFNSLKES